MCVLCLQSRVLYVFLRVRVLSSFPAFSLFHPFSIASLVGLGREGVAGEGREPSCFYAVWLIVTLFSLSVSPFPTFILLFDKISYRADTGLPAASLQEQGVPSSSLFSEIVAFWTQESLLPVLTCPISACCSLFSPAFPQTNAWVCPLLHQGLSRRLPLASMSLEQSHGWWRVTLACV